MINLLPPQTHSQLHASRQNVILLRFAISAFVGIAIVSAIYVTTFFLMKTVEMNSSNSSNENQDKVAAYKKIENSAKEYTQNLQTAKAIFGAESSYSTGLSRIAKALPAGVTLSTITLDPTTIGKPTTLTAKATNAQTALSLKKSLQDANVATNISLAAINNEATTSGTDASKYSYSVSLNLTFSKDLLKPEVVK